MGCSNSTACERRMGRYIVCVCINYSPSGSANGRYQEPESTITGTELDNKTKKSVSEIHPNHFRYVGYLRISPLLIVSNNSSYHAVNAQLRKSRFDSPPVSAPTTHADRVMFEAPPSMLFICCITRHLLLLDKIWNRIWQSYLSFGRS